MCRLLERNESLALARYPKSTHPRMSPESSTTGVHPAPTKSTDRHRFVDLLRGFALLGILAVNIEYIAQNIELGYVEHTSLADLWTRGLIATLGQMKFFLLFSLLFGYGLALQVKSAEASGRSLGKRYGRRLVGLILLGVLHGMPHEISHWDTPWNTPWDIPGAPQRQWLLP